MATIDTLIEEAAEAHSHRNATEGTSVTICRHRPRKADMEAGYDHCMFCVETGDCVNDSAYCTRHKATWDRYQDIAATAF